MSLVELLSSMPAVWLTVVGLLSLLIGSFLNVVILRLPVMMEREWRAQAAAVEGREEGPAEPFNLVVPRSRCPQCGAAVRAWQNIPILSYVLLRGRCAGCSASIGVRYPVVEAFTALASVLVAWRFGVTPEAVAALAFTWTLIALAVIDIDHQLLPDSLTLPLLWLGLLLSLWHDTADATVLFQTPREAIIGAAAGYLSLWSVYHLFRLATGKEGMGYGDFKLLAALGAWLGWQMLPLIILLSAAVGAVVGIALMVFTRRGRDVPIPFGPYLAAAGWIALLYGREIIDAYLGMWQG
ncbi:prepilin peptidase [Lentisalinibacter sediminis]|uniref:prepilin peptidase n=1 Tax=Lentisalinibacter sediminis TaxID=2992237 RepID=UPI00386DEC80